MERDALIRDIENAFENVSLEDGTGIFEAEALDNYASESEIIDARAKDRKQWTRWDEIPFNVLDVAFWALCFVNPKGMRFLLPAYMRIALANYDKGTNATDSAVYALDRGAECFDGNDSILSSEQKAIIVKFLKYMAYEASESLVDTVVAARAYSQHWNQYE